MRSDKKEPVGAINTGRLGNYRKGPWDAVQDEALDTEANHSVAHANLSLYPEADALMDSHQERAYERLTLIAQRSTDPQARVWAREALSELSIAEAFEAVNEANVSDGHGAVKRARVHNHEVIGIAETHRVEAARAQQNGQLP